MLLMRLFSINYSIYSNKDALQNPLSQIYFHLCTYAKLLLYNWWFKCLLFGKQYNKQGLNEQISEMT